MSVRDQLVAAAVQHGAQAVARGGLGLAARVVRTWVYVWLTPVVVAMAYGLWIAHTKTGVPQGQFIGGGVVVAIYWFLPSMAATAFGLVVVAAFRYK